MHPLTEKVVRTLTSCRTTEQLEVATRYYNLAYKKLSKIPGGINDSQLYHLSLIAMGYALCTIKHIEENNVQN